MRQLSKREMIEVGLKAKNELDENFVGFTVYCDSDGYPKYQFDSTVEVVDGEIRVISYTDSKICGWDIDEESYEALFEDKTPVFDVISNMQGKHSGDIYTYTDFDIIPLMETTVYDIMNRFARDTLPGDVVYLEMKQKEFNSIFNILGFGSYIIHFTD